VCQKPESNFKAVLIFHHLDKFFMHWVDISAGWM